MVMYEKEEKIRQQKEENDVHVRKSNKKDVA